MKIKFLLFLIALTLSGSAMSQITIRIGTHGDIGSWNPTSYKSSFSTRAEGQNVAQQIIDIVGLQPNFEVLEANIPNAAAVVYGGKKYVLYNPNFIKQLEIKTGTKWAGISVMAHEIGHHLNGHTTISNGSQPALELQSDEFSGFVLRKMGATLSEAQVAMKTLASVQASKTHPGKYDRLTAIADGWKKADAQMEGRDYVAKPKSPVNTQPRVNNTQNISRTTSSNRVILKNSDLIANVRFNSSPNTNYFITRGYGLISVKNNKLATIGKLSKTNSRNYPYLIHDNTLQLLVDIYGNILTKQGKRVGKLTVRK